MQQVCKDKKQTDIFFFVALLAAVFCVMFLLTLWTPLIADDYNYAFGYASDTRIKSLYDIWNSMFWHRKLLNGRVFAHGWVSFMLMFPRWVFAGVNASVSVFFSYVTIRFLKHFTSCPLQMTATIWMLTWICMPGFGQVFFWTAGSCNYFWGFTLAWFLIWRFYILQNKTKDQKLETVLLILPAFAAGAWSEHISFAMLMVFFFILLFGWIDRKTISWGCLLLLLSGGFGYLYLMLAPSSRLFSRLEAAGGTGSEDILGRLLTAIPRNILISAISAVFIFIVFLLCYGKKKGFWKAFKLFSCISCFGCLAATIGFGIQAWKHDGFYGLISSSTFGFSMELSVYFSVLYFALENKVEKTIVRFSVILFSSGLAALMLFLFAEYLPERGFCAPVMLTALAAAVLLGAFPKKTGPISPARIILITCFAVCLFCGVSDIYSIHQEAVLREAAFAEAAVGNSTVITHPYTVRTKYSAQYGNSDLEPDAGWPNGVMADYYGIKRIIVE